MTTKEMKKKNVLQSQEKQQSARLAKKTLYTYPKQTKTIS